MARALLLICAEDERRRNISKLKIQRRQLRDATDPLSLEDSEFLEQFRLNKSAFEELCREVIPIMAPGIRSTAIRTELKILAALAFYGHGSYQRGVGASYLLNMSQPSLSNCLEEVTEAINTQKILSKYIKFPKKHGSRKALMADFEAAHGMPGVIGCVGCTHVCITYPRTEQRGEYLNSKGYYSLNVLLICDLNLNIMYINASHGGATEDSVLWEQSSANEFLEELRSQGEEFWLLGPTSFNQTPYLMTPLSLAADSAEQQYNSIHASTHSCLSHCCLQLKSRWRCLLSDKELHYSPAKAGKIVNACAVLNNIANAHKVPVPGLSDGCLKVVKEKKCDLEVLEHCECPVRRDLVQMLWEKAQATS